MSEAYRIHFGHSTKSKYYLQAIELAQLSGHCEVLGEGEDAWYIVTLTENQIELMASLYIVAVKVPLPKIYGADLQYTYAYCRSGSTFNYVHASDSYKKRVYAAVERLQNETGKSLTDLAEYLQEKYLHPIGSDMSRVREMLRKESRIDYIDRNTQTWVKAKIKPHEPIDVYKKIQELVEERKYSVAVSAYYQYLGDKYNGELTSELIYLKRLAKIPLSGRDLLYFRSQSSREGLIASHLSEYVACIDEILMHLKNVGRKSPLELLLEYAPTMEELVENLKQKWHKGVYLWDGEFKRDFTPVTLDTFSATYDTCPEGRLFTRYPDQVQHCRTIEYYQDPRHTGLWVTHSPSYYQSEILEKGLHLNGIEAYRHKSWRLSRGKWRKEPDFTKLQSLDEALKSKYTIHGIEYTGRVHQIDGQAFFEVNLLRNVDFRQAGQNPFLELVGEILREAENCLREKNGLPRIGEGWVSETQLFRLVQKMFPDAVQHASPQWLRPQHLDVFIPSRKIAFEYQGSQHFEPIDFFGGQESYERTVIRDQLKIKKCNVNGIILIDWIHTDPIDQSTLIEKLNNAGICIVD